MNTQRLIKGFGWGVVATIAMSALMIAGVATGISPMPAPIPVAIVSRLLGEGIYRPLLILLAAVSHLIYGGIWAAVLFAAMQPVTIWKGMGLGMFLWLIMQLLVLPLLGWGAFGMAIDPRIAVATLILHLVYGVTLGWLADRKEAIPANA